MTQIVAGKAFGAESWRLSASLWLSGKESACNAGRPGFDPWIGKIPWRRAWQSTPVFLSFPGVSDGKESICNVGDLDSIPGFWRSPGGGSSWSGIFLEWRQPTLVFLPGKSRGQRSLAVTVHLVTRVGHDWATTPPPPPPFSNLLSHPGCSMLGDMISRSFSS